MAHARTPDAASTDLKKVGLKATLPRLKILRILEEARVRHLTAEDVYRILRAAGEEVGLATVYRVLTQFEGPASSSATTSRAGARCSRSTRGGHHDHMVCVECGKIFEFHDIAIEERQLKVAEKAGFIVDDHALYLYGVCAGMKKHGKCSKK